MNPTFYTDFDKLSDAAPREREVENTYSTDALLSFASGVQHVQGLAWSGLLGFNRVWAITHNRRATDSNSLLLLCNDPLDFDSGGECYNHFLGSDPHPGGGVQIMGSVLVTGDEENKTHLYDIRDIQNPRLLACQMPDYGGAAGIAWHEGLSVHVLVIGSGGGDRVYVSNGADLSSPACAFEFVSDGENRLYYPGEGLSQLFYDPANARIVSVGGTGDTDGDNQRIGYQSFSLTGSSGNWTLTSHAYKSTSLSGPDVGFGPNLRWGATVRMYPHGMDVVLAARQLTGLGAADPDMTIDVYSPHNLRTGGSVGQSCSVDSDCANSACGREHANDAPKMCCQSGETVRHAGYDYCTRMPKGTVCWLDSMCASGNCRGNGLGIQRGTCS